MRSLTKRPSAGVLAGVLTLVFSASLAAQQDPPPDQPKPKPGQQEPKKPAPPVFNPYAPLPGAAPTLTSTTYPGGGAAMPYTPYTPAYPINPFGSYFDPFGGLYRGVADLTAAYGKYQIDINQARMMNQQVEQMKIETRRKLLEFYREEAANRPTVEDARRINRERELALARQQPPLTEILSARSLNNLLAHLQDMHARNQRGPNVPLDEETLKRMNVTSGRGGNVGLLKNGAKLNWPLSLRATSFNETRVKFEQDLEDAVNRAKNNGQVDASLLRDMSKSLQSLHTMLEKNVGDLSPSQYIDSKRYLNLLDDAMRALQDPNVANYFNRKFEARGKTVADLVDYMGREGLTFAPAVPGDEAAYRALQTSLAAYDETVSRIVTK